MSGELLTPGEALERLACPRCGQWWNGSHCVSCDHDGSAPYEPPRLTVAAAVRIEPATSGSKAI